MAITAGCIPLIKGCTWGNAPYNTYKYPRIAVIKTAGKIKLIPAINNPFLPARWKPQCMVISVELGPGIRFVAPIRSR